MIKKKSTAITKGTKEVTAKGESEFQASFSLTFEITKEHTFPVTMSDITNIVKNGLELKIPTDQKGLTLGTFQEFYDWLNDKFLGGKLPKEIATVAVVKQFMSGEIKIMTFEVKTAGTEDKSQKYDIDVKITFTDPITIIGDLKLAEVEFGVKYEKKAD